MSDKIDIFEVMPKGMNFEQYMQIMRERAEGADEHLDDERLKATPMNLHRSERISKTYQVPDAICQHINKISEKQYWLVLTEPWCGDSSQTLPYFAHYATCNDHIELKIFLRDEHLDIMDLYLTNGNRGIPKLIVFDKNGDEVFNWGPRPMAAQELFRTNKLAGMQKSENIEKVMLWYGRDRGKTLEAEFTEILGSI